MIETRESERVANCVVMHLKMEFRIFHKPSSNNKN